MIVFFCGHTSGKSGALSFVEGRFPKRGIYLPVDLSPHHRLFLFCRQFSHFLYGTERHAFGHTMMDTGRLLPIHHPGHAEVAEISSDLEG